MKNMLGEEAVFEPLRFEWNQPNEGHIKIHLWVSRGKGIFCNVSPNGWTGYHIAIGHKFGEPIIQNLRQNETLTFADIVAIMEEYYKGVSRRAILNECIRAVAREKKITVESAIEYIAEKRIECISI